MNAMLRIQILLAAIIAPASLVAQSSPAAGESDLPRRLDPIEVTVTRWTSPLTELPAAVTVIDGDELARGRLPASLAEALATVPGLFIQNAGNFSQDARIALRGFGAQAAFGIRGVMIVVDGIPQTLPDGQAQVDAIDLGEVQRIEILRGPAAAMYGNAAGGVVRITTRSASATPSAWLRHGQSEFGRRETRLALSGSVGPVGPVGLRLALGRFERDGFRDHARAEQYRASLKADWQPDDATRLDVRVGWFEAPEEQDPGALTAAQARATPRLANPANVRFDAGESLDQWRVGAGLDHRFGRNRNQQVQLAGFGLLRDFSNRLPFESGGQVAFERLFTGLDARWRLDGRLLQRDAGFSAGFDARRQRDERLRFDNLDGVRGARVLDQRERVDLLGAWLQGRVELAPDWTLTAGLRFDEVRLDVNDRLRADGDDSGERVWREVSPGAGLSWRASPALTLFANVGTAFQTPTTTELANPDDPGAGGGFNRALGAETAQSAEFGLRWRRPARGRFEASVYRIRVDDAIASIEVPGFSGSGRDFFTNAGRSTRWGLELAAAWSLTDRLELRGSYSASDFEFDRFVTAEGDFSGKQMPGVPRHRGDVALDWHDPGGFQARLRLIRTGGFYADNANQARNGARTELALDAGWSWRTGRWTTRLVAGVENLLDQRFNDNVRVNAFGGRFFEPAADRLVFARVEVRW